MFIDVLVSWLISHRVKQLAVFLLFLAGWVCFSAWLSTLMVTVRPETPHERLCRCRRSHLPSLKTVEATSWCSEDSSLRGDHQKVVAYSVYGNVSANYTRQRYFSLLPVNAERIAKYYPGWTMRVHYKTKRSDTLAISALCELFCKYPHVDLCEVGEENQRQAALLERLSVNASYLKGLHPFIWRFLPLLEDQVDQLMSRDSDSEISDREIHAVRQWIQSNFTFHLMRDHPLHTFIMLGGLWGVKVNQRRSKLVEAARRMILSGQDDNYGTDQYALEDFVWPFASTDVMTHDSYFCNDSEFNQIPAFPFPTKRNGNRDFVGDVVVESFRSEIEPCPAACRPKNHQDWEFC